LVEIFRRDQSGGSPKKNGFGRGLRLPQGNPYLWVSSWNLELGKGDSYGGREPPVADKKRKKKPLLERVATC